MAMFATMAIATTTGTGRENLRIRAVTIDSVYELQNFTSLFFWR